MQNDFSCFFRCNREFFFSKGVHKRLGTVNCCNFLIWHFLTYYISQFLNTGPQEFCHLETFNASCPHDTVIVMQSARYGRMKVGNCVKRNLGYVGCAVDVMRYMDAHCSGRSSCRVSIVDLAKTEMKPCPEDVTSYLEASYQCLPGTLCWCYCYFNYHCMDTWNNC